MNSSSRTDRILSVIAVLLCANLALELYRSLVPPARAGQPVDCNITGKYTAGTAPDLTATGTVDVSNDNEPPTGSPLLEMPQVIATPHIVGSTFEAQIRVARSLAETSGELLTVLGADDACCNSLVEGVSAGESSGSCSAFGAES